MIQIKHRRQASRHVQQTKKILASLILSSQFAIASAGQATATESTDAIGNADFNQDIRVRRFSDDAVYHPTLQTGYRTNIDIRHGDTITVAINNPSNAIAVIYPDIGEPYRSVFAKIIEGIEDKIKSRVINLAIGANANTQAVANELRRRNVRVVIALGRHGLKVAGALDRDIAIVGGGVISAPEAESHAMSVVSLAPDPDLMFARLKELAPSVRRVIVVYDANHSAWLVRLAREAAKAQNLELVAQEAPDLRTAVRHYQQILGSADPGRDALWLPPDATTAEESSILPLILEKSWDRSLVVFSSNVAHVRRGVLFSLYPNNTELGRSLASTALDYLTSRDRMHRGVTPLKDVLMAVNLRTAGHLGLRFSYEQQRKFDLIFPQP